MLKHVVGVVGALLVEASHGGELGDGRAHDVELVAKRPGDAAGGEDAVHLLAHALARYAPELGRAGSERLLRGGIDGKAEAAREAHGAQDAQGVLLEAAARLPHRADHATEEVFPAAIGVKKPAVRVVGNRVHGEVAAGEVLAHVLHEANLVGMAHVGVGALDAVGGRLHGQAVHDGGHRAVLRARLVHLDAGGAQGTGGLLPRSGGRDVHVVARAAEERVADEAADDPRLVSRFLEHVDDAQGVGGDVDRAGLVSHAILLK